MKNIFVSIFLVLPSLSFAQQDYTIETLPIFPGGNISLAYSINNHGDIIGLAEEYNPQVWNGGYILHPTVWHRDGTVQKIQDSFSGDNTPSWYGINDNMIVTYNIDPPTSLDFFIEDLSMTNSRTDIPIDPHDLNNLGQTLFRNSGDVQGAYIRNYNGTRVYLGAECIPWAINDNMQVAGDGYAQAQGSGFYWDDGTFIELGWMHPLDISNQGVVVGWNAFTGLAAMWDTGNGEATISEMTSANAINEHNQIVGYAQKYDGRHAVLWDNGVSIDLNELLVDTTWDYLAEAMDINDSGQIIGYGYINGYQRSFLMTPVGVPEPCTLMLLGLGCLAFQQRRH